MDYDVEREKRKSEELRKAFRDIFPLAADDDLPSSPLHIMGFLRDRIEHEVKQGTFHWTSQIVRVLCEVSPPKTHAVDMARIVVERAKQADRLDAMIGEQTKELKRLTDEIRSLWDALDESIKLQSHYASLLNQYDGGERMEFKTGRVWRDRLAEVTANAAG